MYVIVRWTSFLTKEIFREKDCRSEEKRMMDERNG